MKASNLLLFALSGLLATTAIFWPEIERIVLTRKHGNLQASGNSTKCPLGYEGPMPSNHPPIRPGPAAGVSKSAVVKPAGPAVASVNAVGSPVAATAFDEALPPNQYLFVNGNIWTANPQEPWASSMAVDSRTGLISAMGPPAASDLSSASQAAAAAAADSDSGGSKVVDLQGAFVTPGFVDPHVHLMLGGLHLLEVNLRHLSSVADMQQRLAAAAEGLPEGAWLLGAGWAEADWGGVLPHAAWIDEACGNHPAFLIRMDHHMALANTLALQMAGLMPADSSSSSSSDIAGSSSMSSAGEVDIDEAGEPSGLLREGAMDLIRRLIPRPDVEQRKAALAAASTYLLSRGVTTVGDMGWGVFGGGQPTWDDLEQLYLPAADEGSLAVRVSAYVPLRTWKRLAHLMQTSGDHHAPSRRLFWGGVKEFLDGSLGSSTALFWEPYQDSSGSSNTGMRTIAKDELKALAIGAAKAGLQVAVHAIGDRAVDELLEVFESVQARVCGDDRCPVRHRIEHVQHISSPVSAAKLSMLDLVAVPNPQHLLSDKAMLLPKLGSLRAGPSKSFAYKTFSNAGALMGFASDWPVVEVDPFESVFAAVYRAAPAAGGGRADEPWAPQEQLPLQEVLHGHTSAAAQAVRLEQLVGTLRPGMVGDFVLWDRSPFEGLGDNGRNGSERGFAAGIPRVVRTYMDGVCVHGCGSSSNSGMTAGGGSGVTGAAADGLVTAAGCAGLDDHEDCDGGDSSAAACDAEAPVACETEAPAACDAEAPAACEAEAPAACEVEAPAAACEQEAPAACEVEAAPTACEQEVADHSMASEGDAAPPTDGQDAAGCPVAPSCSCEEAQSEAPEPTGCSAPECAGATEEEEEPAPGVDDCTSPQPGSAYEAVPDGEAVEMEGLLPPAGVNVPAAEAADKEEDSHIEL